MSTKNIVYRSTASVAIREGSPCRQNDSSGDKSKIYSGPDLPEDIWGHIHSLMPLRDAARIACVSRAFIRSWRGWSNLYFDEEIMGLNSTSGRKDFTSKVDHILKKHAGIGMKTFGFEFYEDLKSFHVDRWLQIALKAGVEELMLYFIPCYTMSCFYNFPCSFLFDGIENRIRYLSLADCAFRPTTGFSCLRRLELTSVGITGEELECLISNSFNLEQLTLRYCKEIISLKIPSLLQHLSYLHVFECTQLEVIEIKAPNLTSYNFGGFQVEPSFGELFHVRNMELQTSTCTVHYACAKLPSIAPNLEALSITSFSETINTPIVHVKFLHLKYLSIYLGPMVEEGFSPAYDYFSLIYFLDACPILETFYMQVLQYSMDHDSIVGDSSPIRQMPKYCHANLKYVKITGFCSAKSMVELVCHIIDNAASLECLTIDTIFDYMINTVDRSSVHKIGKCRPTNRCMIKEAHRTLLAIGRHIVGKIPPTVKLNVLEPCSWCHVIVD